MKEYLNKIKIKIKNIRMNNKTLTIIISLFFVFALILALAIGFGVRNNINNSYQKSMDTNWKYDGRTTNPHPYNPPVNPPSSSSTKFLSFSNTITLNSDGTCPDYFTNGKDQEDLDSAYLVHKWAKSDFDLFGTRYKSKPQIYFYSRTHDKANTDEANNPDPNKDKDGSARNTGIQTAFSVPFIGDTSSVLSNGAYCMDTTLQSYTEGISYFMAGNQFNSIYPDHSSDKYYYNQVCPTPQIGLLILGEPINTYTSKNGVVWGNESIDKKDVNQNYYMYLVFTSGDFGMETDSNANYKYTNVHPSDGVTPGKGYYFLQSNTTFSGYILHDDIK